MQQILRKALLPMLAVGALATAVPAVAADVYVRDRAPRAPCL